MTEFSATPFNIVIATNNAYRRWGFAIENKEEAVEQIAMDNKGNVIVSLDEPKEAVETALALK